MCVSTHRCRVNVWNVAVEISSRCGVCFFNLFSFCRCSRTGCCEGGGGVYTVLSKSLNFTSASRRRCRVCNRTLYSLQKCNRSIAATQTTTTVIGRCVRKAFSGCLNQSIRNRLKRGSKHLCDSFLEFVFLCLCSKVVLRFCVVYSFRIQCVKALM